MRQAFSIDLFKEIPKTPGVYLLKDEQRRILYVGQSKSLRTRLAYYRNAKVERVPRKIIQLASKVREIHWLNCETPEDAELCELEMLRLHRPRFNVANAHPQNYLFVTLRRCDDGVAFHQTEAAGASAGESVHGAYKSRTATRRAILALARIGWMHRNPSADVFSLPSHLVQDHAPKSSTALFPETDRAAAFDEIDALFAGASSAFIDRTRSTPPAERFLNQLHESDCAALDSFFLAAKRNFDLRQAAGITRPILHPAELNDLLAWQRAERKRARSRDATTASKEPDPCAVEAPHAVSSGVVPS